MKVGILYVAFATITTIVPPLFAQQSIDPVTPWGQAGCPPRCSGNPVPQGQGAPPGILLPGLSLTCQFTGGPRSGTSLDFSGMAGVTPAPIGSPCTDGVGSSGYAVPQNDRGPYNQGGPGQYGQLPPGLSLTCQFTGGPRAGTSFDFSGMAGVTPAPVGSPCTDGAGSTGHAVR